METDYSDHSHPYVAFAADLLPMAALALTRTGEIVWTNSRGAALLRKGDAVRREGRRIATVDHSHDLHAEIAAAATGNPGGAVRFVKLARTGGEPPYEGAIINAPSSSDGQRPAAALLLIHDPSVAAPCNRNALLTLYGFSRAETAVAERLVTGMELKEIARDLNLSLHTIKAHLKRLFAKTRTTRQAELVLVLVGGLASLPFGNATAQESRSPILKAVVS